MMEKRLKVLEQYNGDTVVVMPELDKQTKPSVANLLGLGLDQFAERIASVLPDITYPSLRPGYDIWDEKARQSRLANLGWWDMNRMELLEYKRARYLLAYASAPVTIHPTSPSASDQRKIPHWRVRSPLVTFPAECHDEMDCEPMNYVICHKYPLSWLQNRYPRPTAVLYKGKETKIHQDMMFEVLEYNDADETVLVAVGQARERDTGSWQDQSAVGGAGSVVLDRAPNRAEICNMVVPGRITLDKPIGHFDTMLHLFASQAKMAAYEEIGMFRSIFQEQWVQSHPNAPTRPKIVRDADGKNGVIGIIENGVLQTVGVNPGQQVPTAIDRLERAARLAGGIPAEFGGEAACLDPETEILTDQGWKRYFQVDVGTQVLTLNHETGMSEWKPIQKMNVYGAEPREMLEAEGPRHSSLSTLNHRWPTVVRGNRTWRVSEDLTSNDQIPIAAMNADVPVEPKWSDALVEAVAWFWTEGFVRASGGQISQSIKNSENVERIRAALTALWGPPTTNWRDLSGCGQGGVGHDRVPRWSQREPNYNGIVRFDLSRHAVDLLWSVCPDKVPDYGFLMSLTQAQLELFIKVSMLADNCGPDRLGQKDIRRSDAFAFAVILSGSGVSYQTRVKQESRPGWRPGGYVANIVRVRKRRFVKPKENALRGSSTFQKVIRNVAVWCPTTENGTWLARRHGSVYFTGNSNIRTGRRGAQVMGDTVDMPLQEYQQILASGKDAENVRAVKTMKGNFGFQMSMYVIPRDGKINQIKGAPNTYVPNDVFVSDFSKANYPFLGADASSIPIEIGQRVGTGEMSLQTAREMDPRIPDPVQEANRVISEGLEKALLGGMEQMLASGQTDPIVVAKVEMALRKDPTAHFADIYVQVHEEMQKEQAAMQAAQPPQPAALGAGSPGTGGPSPAAMPGAAVPPGGAAPQPLNPPPGAGQTNLAQLVSSLGQSSKPVG